MELPINDGSERAHRDPNYRPRRFDKLRFGIEIIEALMALAWLRTKETVQNLAFKLKRKEKK